MLESGCPLVAKGEHETMTPPDGHLHSSSCKPFIERTHQTLSVRMLPDIIHNNVSLAPFKRSRLKRQPLNVLPLPILHSSDANWRHPYLYLAVRPISRSSNCWIAASQQSPTAIDLAAISSWQLTASSADRKHGAAHVQRNRDDLLWPEMGLFNHSFIAACVNSLKMALLPIGRHIPSLRHHWCRTSAHLEEE